MKWNDDWFMFEWLQNWTSGKYATKIMNGQEDINIKAKSSSSYAILGPILNLWFKSLKYFIGNYGCKLADRIKPYMQTVNHQIVDGSEAKQDLIQEAILSSYFFVEHDVHDGLSQAVLLLCQPFHAPSSSSWPSARRSMDLTMFCTNRAIGPVSSQFHVHTVCSIPKHS